MIDNKISWNNLTDAQIAAAAAAKPWAALEFAVDRLTDKQIAAAAVAEPWAALRFAVDRLTDAQIAAAAVAAPSAALRFAVDRLAKMTAIFGFDLPNPAVAHDRITAIAQIATANPRAFQMGSWHSDCGTAHCLAGWAVVHAGEEGRALEREFEARGHSHPTASAGLVLLGVEAAPYFFDADDARTSAWLATYLPDASPQEGDGA